MRMQDDTLLSDARTQEFAPPVRLGPIKICRQGQRTRLAARSPLRREQEGTDHQQKSNKARDRVAWQTDEGCRMHPAVRQGLARFHRDLPHLDRTFSLYRRFDMV